MEKCYQINKKYSKKLVNNSLNLTKKYIDESDINNINSHSTTNKSKKNSRCVSKERNSKVTNNNHSLTRKKSHLISANNNPNKSNHEEILKRFRLKYKNSATLPTESYSNSKEKAKIILKSNEKFPSVKSPRNRNVALHLHNKISEKETNSKTETTIQEKKDYTLTMTMTNPKQEQDSGYDMNLSLLNSLEIEEKEKKNEIQKDKLISKLNNRISDLESKLQEMEMLLKSNTTSNQLTTQKNEEKTSLILTLDNENYTNCTNYNNYNTEGSVQNYNKKLTIPTSSASSNKIKQKLNLSVNANNNLKLKNFSKLKKNVNLFPNKLLSINLPGKQQHGQFNMDFFKPLPGVNKEKKTNSIFDLYTNKNSLLLPNNKSKLGKTSIKNSMEKSKELIVYRSAVTKCPSIQNSPREMKNNRKHLFMNEIKLNNSNDSLDLSKDRDNVYITEIPVDKTETGKTLKHKYNLSSSNIPLPVPLNLPYNSNKDMAAKLIEIKERTKKLLSNLTDVKIKSHSYSKSNVY